MERYRDAMNPTDTAREILHRECLSAFDGAYFSDDGAVISEAVALRAIEAALSDSTASIVAWLRNLTQELGTDEPVFRAAHILAYRIEAGDHLPLSRIRAPKGK